MKINYRTLLNKNIADILIVTATDIETEMLHKALEPVCTEGLLEIEDEGHCYFAGILGGYNIIHCQCEKMGTQEKGSSILTTTTALKTWPCIKAVIMLGIAFGMYENEGETPQHFSDVLVACKIFPYENQRFNHDGSVTYRGKEHCASIPFIDAFTVIARNWQWENVKGESTRIEICPLLSGEKLVDDITKRNELKSYFKEYRGGEMEGIGLAAVCEEHGKPWILLKAICDFADGNKGLDKKEKQADAAKAAVHACTQALQTINVSSLIDNKTNYWYRPSELDLSKVFFVHYDTDCSPYYLERNVDVELQLFVIIKGCWVYGNSGMGKSELLTRTLIHNNVEYIYIDLSLCSKNNVLDTFDTIYESICAKLNKETEEISCFEDYVKEICKILNSEIVTKHMYLLIDEIPFEHKSMIFREFVDKFCSMMNYCSRNIKGKTILFMVSSIASPLEAIDSDDYKNKIAQYIKFLELKDWTMEECTKLIDLLTKVVYLDWSDFKIEDFIEKFKYSPRLIKNALKESCSLGYRKIDDIVINRIIVG